MMAMTTRSSIRVNAELRVDLLACSEPLVLFDPYVVNFINPVLH